MNSYISSYNIVFFCILTIAMMYLCLKGHASGMNDLKIEHLYDKSSSVLMVEVDSFEFVSEKEDTFLLKKVNNNLVLDENFLKLRLCLEEKYIDKYAFFLSFFSSSFVKGLSISSVTALIGYPDKINFPEYKNDKERKDGLFFPNVNYDIGCENINCEIKIVLSLNFNIIQVVFI